VDAAKVAGTMPSGDGRPGPEGRVDDGIPAEFRESFAVLANLGFVREH
jgi:hypothetical protein